MRRPYSPVMERTDEGTRPGGSAEHGAIGGAPAHRDAAAIVARAEADEAEADRARERYRTGAMPALEPGGRIAALLEPDEHVVAVRRSAFVDRRQPAAGADARAGADAPTGVAGDLYLTSRRLIVTGRVTLSFELGAIEETMLSGERLLLVLRDGRGASIDVSQPRLLRVEIAAARASARR